MSFFMSVEYYLGPDRLELIIFNITGKKIYNHRSRLESIISFILDFFSCNLFCYMTDARLDAGSTRKWSSRRPHSLINLCSSRSTSSPFIN